jgi:hypothetical protein
VPKYRDGPEAEPATPPYKAYADAYFETKDSASRRIERFAEGMAPLVADAIGRAVAKATEEAAHREARLAARIEALEGELALVRSLRLAETARG